MNAEESMFVKDAGMITFVSLEFKNALVGIT